MWMVCEIFAGLGVLLSLDHNVEVSRLEKCATGGNVWCDIFI